MIKKIGLILGAAALALVAAVTPASAATGWQTLGYDGVVLDNNAYVSNYHTGKVFTAVDGGNIGIKIPWHNAYGWTANDPAVTNKISVKLYEYDAENGDEYIGKLTFNQEMGVGKTLTFNVAPFVDGTNGKAEIYAIYQANYKANFTASILD